MNMEQQPGSPKKSSRNLDVKTVLGALGLAVLAGTAERGADQSQSQQPQVERAESESAAPPDAVDPEEARSPEAGYERVVTDGYVLHVRKPESVTVVTPSGESSERLESFITVVLPDNQVVSTFILPEEASFIRPDDRVSVTYRIYPPEEGQKTPYLQVESVTPYTRPA